MDAGLASGTQSLSHHGKALFVAPIARNPKRAAIVLAALIVVVVILAASLAMTRTKYKACLHPKSGMLNKINNLNTGGMNSLWQMGSDSAAGWGSSSVAYIPDSISDANKAALFKEYRPEVRKQMMARAARLGRAKAVRSMRLARGSREGMYATPCKPGDVQTTDSNGSPVCMTPQEYQASVDATEAAAAAALDADADDTTDADWTLSTCGSSWDPAATAEVQAIGSLGAIDHEPYAEGRLQSAIDAGYDTSKGLSDAQLTTLMHTGGAP